jgi:hypothetical protein
LLSDPFSKRILLHAIISKFSSYFENIASFIKRTKMDIIQHRCCIHPNVVYPYPFMSLHQFYIHHRVGPPIVAARVAHSIVLASCGFGPYTSLIKCLFTRCFHSLSRWTSFWCLFFIWSAITKGIRNRILHSHVSECVSSPRARVCIIISTVRIVYTMLNATKRVKSMRSIK